MLFMKPLLDAAYPDEPGTFGDGEADYGGGADAEGSSGGGEMRAPGGMPDDVGRAIGVSSDYMCPNCYADIWEGSGECTSCGTAVNI